MNKGIRKLFLHVTSRNLPKRCVSSARSSTESRQDDKDWKTKLIKVLGTEYRHKGRLMRSEKEKKNALADILRFSLEDDIQSIIRIAERQTRARQTSEVLPVCLLVVNKRMEDILAKTETINSNEALSLFLSVVNFSKSLKRLDDNESASIMLLLINSLRKWKDQREHNQMSKTIEDGFDSIWQKVNSIIKEVRPEELNTFVDSESRRCIQEEFGRMKRVFIPSRRIGVRRYDPDLSLVDKLQNNCSEDQYIENPFQIDSLDKSAFEKLFDSNLQQEACMMVNVKNRVAGEDYEKYAEDLIDEWQWKRNISESISSINPEETHPLIATCLRVLPRERFVNLLLLSAISACSQGQNLTSASQFQNDLMKMVLWELGDVFKAKMGFQESEVWKRVFNVYCQYFLDSSISRNYTHREWWTHSCKTEKIAPNFHLDAHRMDQQTTSEVFNILFDVLQKSCLFPVTAKNSTRASWHQAFSFRSVAVEEESRITTDSRHALSRMLAIHTKMMKMFEVNPFKYIVFPTEHLPMTVPPRPWIDNGIGGPLYLSSAKIIRNMMEFKDINMNEEVKTRITSPQQARPVYDALNQLGATPWVINEDMLGVLKTVFDKSSDSSSKPLLDKLNIPMRLDTFDIPEFEKEFGVGAKKEDIEINRFRDYARRKAEAIKNRNESNSLWCWMLYRVVLADHFRGQTLYFPHNMDFRGRVYPLSPYLSHMGDDVNRCILKFAKAKALGEGGFDWLKLHCINLTGTMKRSSVADRMSAVNDLLPTIVDSARNPLDGEKWWMESDEPWQTLATCIEINEAMKYGSDISQFQSQLPVHQDGSCNGLQHYAALGRDNEGGTQVNLTNCDLPNDVYSDVAQRVEQKRLLDEKEQGEIGDVARKLRECLPQNVPRKVIKQTVMTTVYGVTMYGAVLQIKRQLRALDISNDDSALFARYLARKTFHSLNDAFTSSMALKDWFRLCAKGTSELLRTVEWVTPLGLPVVQPYCKVVDRKGKLILAPISTKQVDAFPPNFVHSLDSTHMMLTSLNCSHRGITFAAVHDCFWTHAKTVDEMNAICRQQFVLLHSQPIVQQCSDWFKDTYLTPTMRKILPPDELEKYTSMFTAKVQPGNLDIEQVKNSVYFFS